MAEALRRSPLHATHRSLGAQFFEFAGWEMPLQFTSILEEHRAVRERAGLFDVSHLGQVEMWGPGAGRLLQTLLTNDVSRLEVGQAQYTLLCNEEGGVIDDLILYRRARQRYLLVVNAANAQRDLAWIRSYLPPEDVTLEHAIGRAGLLALQGPRAARILEAVSDPDPDDVPAFGSWEARVGGVAAFVGRTGYTGEDGFELSVQGRDATPAWQTLMEAGAAEGILPAGLGARDTLRLEAALALHGNELDEETTPLEAGLSWTVAWDKGEFVGRDRLLVQRSDGVDKRLVGLRMLDPGIPRHGYRVLEGDRPVGSVTSGSFSPTLRGPIALAYVPPRLAEVGSEVMVDIRGRPRRAEVVRKPFYKRKVEASVGKVRNGEKR
ncbi:MAG: glycine cleavage system aminomethyltransferase GcvT [Anaerolineae bacterium]